MALFEPWLAALDTEPGVAVLDRPSMPDVVVAAMRGATGALAREWIANAAVTHIIGWRLDGYLLVDVSDSDRVLPAGEAATQWVVDRFTETYLDSWSRASLDWELVFLHDPITTARRVGLTPEMLAERPTTAAQIVEALGRRLTGSVGDDPVSGGLRTVEIVETIVGMLRDGDTDEARSLAQKAVQNAPENSHLCNALAFCLIPVDAVRAGEMLDRMPLLSGLAQAAAQVNRATLALMSRDLDATDRHVNRVPSDPENGGWFWDPVSILDGSAHLTYVTFADWRGLAQEAIATVTASGAC